MKKLNKSIAILLALACTAGALASCAKKTESKPSVSTPPITSELPAEEPSSLQTNELAPIIPEGYEDMTKENAVSLYLDASERTDSLTSFAAELDITKELYAHEFVKSSTAQTRVAVSTAEALSLHNSYGNTITLYDSSTVEESRSLYYSDGTMYMADVEGKKEYYPLSEEDAQSLASSYSNVALEFPSEIFAESVVTRNESDTSVMALTAVENITDLISTFTADDLSIYYTPVSDSFDITYSDEALLGFTVNKNGCFDRMTIEYMIYFTHSMGEGSARMTVDVRFVDNDGTVEITAPDSLDEYTPYLGEEEPTQDEMDAQYMEDTLALFDENNKRIPDFGQKYIECCMKYGKQAVDNIVDTFESLSSAQ